MSGPEADELYSLIIRVFPNVDAERAYRVRGHLFDSGLNVGIGREIVMRHRETHKYLEEPDLLADLAKTVGKPLNADAAKVAAEQLRKARKEQERQLQKDLEADQRRCLDLLKQHGPDALRQLHPGAAVVLKRMGKLPAVGVVFETTIRTGAQAC